MRRGCRWDRVGAYLKSTVDPRSEGDAPWIRTSAEPPGPPWSVGSVLCRVWGRSHTNSEYGIRPSPETSNMKTKMGTHRFEAVAPWVRRDLRRRGAVGVEVDRWSVGAMVGQVAVGPGTVGAVGAIGSQGPVVAVDGRRWAGAVGRGLALGRGEKSQGKGRRRRPIAGADGGVWTHGAVGTVRAPWYRWWPWWCWSEDLHRGSWTVDGISTGQVPGSSTVDGISTGQVYPNADESLSSASHGAVHIPSLGMGDDPHPGHPHGVAPVGQGLPPWVAQSGP